MFDRFFVLDASGEPKRERHMRCDYAQSVLNDTDIFQVPSIVWFHGEIVQYGQVSGKVKTYFRFKKGCRLNRKPLWNNDQILISQKGRNRKNE